MNRRTFAGLLLLAVAAFLAVGQGTLTDSIGPQAAPRVLVIEESAERGKLTPEQLSILHGTAPGTFAAIAAEACGPSGFIVLDKDTDPAKMPDWVRLAFSQPSQVVPRFIIVRGNRLTLHALPKDTAAAIELLKRG
jgi:hypothetical protein